MVVALPVLPRDLNITLTENSSLIAIVLRKLVDCSKLEFSGSAYLRILLPRRHRPEGHRVIHSRRDCNHAPSPDVAHALMYLHCPETVHCRHQHRPTLSHRLDPHQADFFIGNERRNFPHSLPFLFVPFLSSFYDPYFLFFSKIPLLLIYFFSSISPDKH